MRVLLTSQPGSGHWRPLLPLVMALQEAGHTVAFATTPVACAAITPYGMECFGVGADEWLDEDRSSRRANPGIIWTADQVWREIFVRTRARRSLPDLLALCRSWQPDLIIRESTEFAGCIAAEVLGLPDATIQVGCWRPEYHRLVGTDLEQLRAEVDLPPDPEQRMLVRNLTLFQIPPSFIEPSRPVPSTAEMMRYVPFDQGPEPITPPDWLERLDSRPTVYATLGTAYNDTPGVFAAIIAALRDAPLNLIVTIGPDQDPAAFGEQPSHVRIERYLPQSVVVPFCNLVLCHGGFGTMLTALGAGLPLVMMPIAADQPENARRCAELEAAEVIAAEHRTPQAIREATQAVLAGARYRRNARRLQDEMRSAPPLEQTVMLLEQLALTGEVVC
jgi:UDP:flavonoid glycosyltransferase YjiC (YdhE family)